MAQPLSNFIKGNESRQELIRIILRININHLSPTDLSTLRDKIGEIIDALQRRDIAESSNNILTTGWFGAKVMRLEEMRRKVNEKLTIIRSQLSPEERIQQAVDDIDDNTVMRQDLEDQLSSASTEEANKILETMEQLDSNTEEKEKLIRTIQDEIYARDLSERVVDINNNLTKSVKSPNKKAGIETAKKLVNIRGHIQNAVKIVDGDDEFQCRFFDVAQGERCTRKFGQAGHRRRHENTIHRDGVQMID